MSKLWRTTSHYGDVMPKKEGNYQTKKKSNKAKRTRKTRTDLCPCGGKKIEKIGLQTKITDYAQTALDRIGLKSVIMIMDAHIHNIIEPGSYSKTESNTIKEWNFLNPTGNSRLRKTHKPSGNRRNNRSYD